MAAAILELWPKSLLTLGPAIEDGFYYDVDFGDTKISDDELPKIEAKMHELVKTWKGFEKIAVTKEEALKDYKNNPYKTELINGIEGEITYFESGKFADLCRGGHVDNPSKELKYFKLLSVAGAYWRGDEKNKMLTRIYGTAFPSQKELDEFITLKAEAEKRNHKKLGRELELFIFHETAPGMAYWLPKGVVLYNELVNFWREEHKKYNYQEIVSPLLNKRALYETSGHWDHYEHNMFNMSIYEEEELKKIKKEKGYETAMSQPVNYCLKPMNCPNAMVVFGFKTRTYKELPLKLGDTDTLHRREPSGTLNGLLRIREFRQDDAHIFVKEEQIKSQFEELFEITKKFYSVFGLEYSFRLGTRPKDFMGNPKVWDKAEKELKEILEKSGKKFTVLEGDGAFYGPKIDILMKDSLGRDWQMGTLQLDFQIPIRFDLKYSAEDGTQKTPVVIHRVIYGSLERFIGIITEHFAGNFPTWLTPVQVKVLPIAERHLKYANKVFEKLKEAGIRVELDERNETLGNKIRNAQTEKVNYMLIIGDKEVETKTVTERARTGEQDGPFPVETFIKNIKEEIDKKLIWNSDRNGSI